MSQSSQIRIGIDVGGTFTDFVTYHPGTGKVDSFKLPSTPINPADAVMEGLSTILREVSGPTHPTRFDVIHGSTVATNALLERKGATCALITTAGFRDVLEIGRQNRPSLYDLSVNLPPPLISEIHRHEVSERIDHQGNEVVDLDGSEVEQIIERILEAGIHSVAICLLFSFLNDQNERAIGKMVRSNSLFASVSSEVLPEFREYERTSTTCINAYVTPLLKPYFESISKRISEISNSAESHLRIMQSNGGAIGIDEAGNFGVSCILSGPAGGIIGARRIGLIASLGDSAGGLRSLTFDMGGTSTDVSLIHGSPAITTENVIGGYPIHIPMLDIHTIGAGGGSIARLDRGNALRVGPESAGAFPGPACFGHSGPNEAVPTVTDANLVLGRIRPEYFLGGKMEIFPEKAMTALRRLAEELEMELFKTASGVIEIINSHMEHALRLISIERGYDPRDYSLVSFGGAGGLHAAELAHRLGISTVVIPPQAATLSAYGLLVADVVKDYSKTVMLSESTPFEEVSLRLDKLVNKGISDVRSEGVSQDKIHCEKFLDLRYRGQSYELMVPFSPSYRQQFDRLHQESYGYTRPPGEPIEIVNLRARVTGYLDVPIPAPQDFRSIDPSQALLDHFPVFLQDQPESIPCYLGERLLPGNQLTGPALILRSDTVILLPEGTHASVDGFLNVILSI